MSGLHQVSERAGLTTGHLAEIVGPDVRPRKRENARVKNFSLNDSKD